MGSLLNPTQPVTPDPCCCSSIYHYENEIVLNHSPRPRRFRGRPANPTIGSKTGRETAQKFLPGPANGQHWIQRRSKTAPRLWIQREPVRKEQCQRAAGATEGRTRRCRTR